MNIKQFYTIIACVLMLISCGIIRSLKANQINDTFMQSLDFRVKECLKTRWPADCIRSRGLIIPGQSRIHRFVIYGGELNVWARPTTGTPHEDPQKLNEDFLQILISSNARLNLKDGLGLTALDYAGRGTHMYTILERAGARHSKDL